MPHDHSHEKNNHNHNHKHSHEHHTDEHSEHNCHSHNHQEAVEKENVEFCDHEKGQCITENAINEEECHECCEHCSIDIPASPVAVHDDCHSEDLMGGCHMDSFTSSATQSQTIVFILALSLHSFLEGLGMGSKKDHASLVSFLISLFAHKWLEAFALGVAVLRARYSSTRTFILLGLYSILTPVGMMGSVILKKFVLHPRLSLILDGLAAGSFLFVSCIEMIPPEFHHADKHTKFKFILLSIGFAFMAFIQKFHKH